MIFGWAFIALFFLLAAGYYSGAEMGLYSLNRLRLRLSAGRSSDPRARALLELSEHRERTVLAILLTQNVMNYLLTVATISLIVEATGMAEGSADIYAAIVLSPLTFVFGDVVPKNWFQLQANRLLYPTVLLVQACVAIFKYTGVLWLLESLTRLLAELTGQEDQTQWRGARGEVIGLLRETAATGTLTEEQTRMMERVMNLSSIHVGSIMIPRRHVVDLPAAADRATFERIVERYNYSRLPVLSADRREVVGVVNVYDVLADPSGGPLQGWIQKPLHVRADASATQAMLELRKAHEPMGIVIDRRRGYVGILTLKDLVEEIFGELAAW